MYYDQIWQNVKCAFSILYTIPSQKTKHHAENNVTEVFVSHKDSNVFSSPAADRLKKKQKNSHFSHLSSRSGQAHSHQVQPRWFAPPRQDVYVVLFEMLFVCLPQSLRNNASALSLLISIYIFLYLYVCYQIKKTIHKVTRLMSHEYVHKNW